MGLREWAYVALAALIVSALGYAYHVVRKAGYDEAKQECLRAAEVQRRAEAAKGNEASTKLEGDRVKVEIVYRSITKTVDRYIDRPVYRAECFDADGLRDANAALRGEIADPGKPAGRVPGAGAAGERDRGGGAAQADRGEPPVLRVQLEAQAAR